MPKVVVLPADDSGCGHYRLTFAAKQLAEEGADITILPVGTTFRAEYTLDRATGERRMVAIDFPPCDVFVTQRSAERMWADCIPLLQRNGIRVVIDYDDDFHAIDRRNAAFAAYHPHTNPEHNIHHVASCARQADLVTCSTPGVARRYGGHGRVAMIPNCVPQWYLDVPRYDGPPKVVWSGQVHSHPGDCEVTRGAVERALRATGATFLNIGSGEDVRSAFGLADEPETTTWVPIHDYPKLYGQATVAVCPLRVNVFNNAKSSIKALEALALGMPVVASPSEAYLSLAAESGACISLADKPKVWQRQLTNLLTDSQLAESRSQAGRDIAARHTVEGNIERWAQAWGL